MGFSRVRAAALVALAAGCWVSGSSRVLAQTVDEIVAKHIEARGGYDRIKAIQTLKITRTVATPFSSVTVVIYKKRPNLLRMEQTPKGGAMAPRGVNADVAWDLQQNKLLTRPEKVALETREVEADFDGLLVDWKEKGHTVTLEGSEPITGRDAWKLKVTTKGGFVRYVFIDKQTFMETGMSGRVLTPAVDPKTGEHRFNDSVWVFSDFRDVNGVKFPFSIDEDRTGGPITQSFATYTDRIEVNVPMDDALFNPPAGATAGGRP
ncbi:MAG TPA: hypothetical protein VM364_14045 [Vicinamibacterales bacterium]|nr:hypothetical protein [Vicinamibacterales bacterium]